MFLNDQIMVFMDGGLVCSGNLPGYLTVCYGIDGPESIEIDTYNELPFKNMVIFQFAIYVYHKLS